MSQKRKTTQRKPAEQPATPVTTKAATPEPAAAEAPKPRKDPRYCVVDGCTRLRLTADNVETQLCGGHWASRRGDG